MHGDTYDLLVLWVATVGQTLFVVLWASQRWWSSNIGQALLAKSASLALILAATLWANYYGHLPEWVARFLFTIVAAAIVRQLAVMTYEVYRAARDRRRLD